MLLHSPYPSFFLPFTPRTSIKTSLSTFNNVKLRFDSDSFRTRYESRESDKTLAESSSCSNRLCFCGRRRFLETLGPTLFPISTSIASDLHPDHDPDPDDAVTMLNRFHPPKPDWYEELYAFVLNTCTKSYEAEITGYKSELFANLRGKANKILEIGIGTGPNLKYYASDAGVNVFGIDPNRKMEKYAQAAAVAAGLPPTNFKFIQAVAEALPVSDASVDAVVGTLVLCSVKDVDMTLQEVRRVLKPGGLYIFVEHVAAEDGTVHRFVQGVLDPLQQKVSDGCHLTRKTEKNISAAGFTSVDIKMASLSTASLVNPHVYGMACK